MGSYGQSINISSPFFTALTDNERIIEQSILMTLSTRKGTLWIDPDYGCLLSDYIAAGLTDTALARVPSDVRAAIERDERIDSAAVTANVRFAPRGVRLELTIQVTPSSGEIFALTLAVNDVTAEKITRGGT